jgi:TorA maturation chaperone TorD
MSGTVTPLNFQPPEIPEDQARAGYYALLARLFYAGPDVGLLAAIVGAEGPEDRQSALSEAWNALAAAARETDVEAARLEYDQLFVGTGKAEVTPYATFYLSETGREKILVRLRSELASLGLRRADSSPEPEDHIAALFDVMRHLISLGSGESELHDQQDFFSRYIARSFGPLCDATSASAKADFYRHVARFARSFLYVESEALKVF